MLKKYFITGTDTNIGKTYVCLRLLENLKNKNIRTVALKPIASDCKIINSQLYNDDALLLQKFSTLQLPYHYINPNAYEQPTIPAFLNAKLDVQQIKSQYQNIDSLAADICLIEGFGGWHAPINENESVAEMAKMFAGKIILVVGMRLGCLNHTLLTYEAIINSGCELAGWIANYPFAEMNFKQENLDFLRKKIAAPLLGVIPYNAPENNYLDVEILLK